MDNCKHVVKINPARDHSILNPQKWLCNTCGTTESVWACLSCAHVACGRYNEEHALQHYQDTKHPLALEVNEKYVYCYECEDYVLNDNAAGDIKLLRTTLKAIASQSFNDNDLASRGRRFLRSRSFPGCVQRVDSQLQDKDRCYTALWHRRQVLLGKTFNQWRENVRQIRHPHVDDEPISEPPGANHVYTNSGRGGATSLRKKRTIIPGVTGLRNLGNTCYMNAILQVLSHLPEFKDYMSDSESSNTRNTRSATSPVTPVRQSPRLQRQTTVECFEQATSTPLRKMGLNGGGTTTTHNNIIQKSPTDTKSTKEAVSLCNELHVLLRVMWSGQWAIVSPQSMLHAVWNVIPFFRGYSQQDAQEFLCEVLDKVENEIEKNSRKIRNRRSSNNTPSNLITALFQGQLVSQLTCQNCKKISETKEPFQDLSLEFPDRYQLVSGSTMLSQESCHLTEMLAKFTDVEDLEDDAPIYECSKCNSRRRSVSKKPVIKTHACKRFLISGLPRVLRLHLKRFRWVGRNHREKINVHVRFEHELNMKPFCIDSIDSPVLYNLSSVVIHHGRGFSSGHYTAYCWNNEADSWIHCNDNRLGLCDIKEVTKSQAYILVYTRKDLSDRVNAAARIRETSPSNPVSSPLRDDESPTKVKTLLNDFGDELSRGSMEDLTVDPSAKKSPSRDEKLETSEKTTFSSSSMDDEDVNDLNTSETRCEDSPLIVAPPVSTNVNYESPLVRSSTGGYLETLIEENEDDLLECVLDSSAASELLPLPISSLSSSFHRGENTKDRIMSLLPLATVTPIVKSYSGKRYAEAEDMPFVRPRKRRRTTTW
ncbi:ubiquitin carboxyl-terminal hydrolase 44-like isoform X2 [Tubulanus polymorphus]|uniref:ubiquitin carboxyl-terminal hydrolase 44-like isoform X2 n=1 Tax=Tubulanus polymorphus TaxID=672921 RepID=UPI003DA5FA93